ncbi:MAG: hypothetical protein ABFR33_03765 [Verrucomicrobiota bacterium]
MKRTIALLISMLFAMGANAQLDWTVELAGPGGGYPRMAQKADGTLLMGVDHVDGIRLSQSPHGGSWSDLPAGGIVIPNPAATNELVGNVSPLVLPNGDILIACRHLNDTDAYDPGTPDGIEFFDICVHKSTDGGATWSYLSSPVMHPDSPHGTGTDGNQGVWEPFLYQHSPTEIWCLYTWEASRGVRPSLQKMKRSTDGGATWGAEEIVVGTSQFGATGHAGMASVAKADNGDLIAVFETDWSTDDGLKIGMVRSTDNGASWGSISTVYDRPGSGGYVGAPHIVKMDDGTLVVSYQQHGGGTQTMGYVTSADHGSTWSSNYDLFATDSAWSSLFVDADGTLYGLRTGVTYKKHYPGGMPNTIAYWRFEEGSDGSGSTGVHAGDWDNHYLDVSGFGNSMSTWPIEGGSNRPAYTVDRAYTTVQQTGATNTLALDFARDPAQDISTFSQQTGLKMAESYMFTNGWTVECTFKLNSLGWQVLVGKDGQRGDLGGSGGVGSEAPFWLKLLDFNKHLEVLAIDDDDNFHVAATLAPIETNQWYSVAVRFDGTAIDLWLKGPGDTGYVFQNCSDFFGPDVGGVGCSLGGFSGTNIMNSGSWSIGRGAWNDGPVDFVDGVIDEVRISNKALAPPKFLAAGDPVTLAYWRFEEGATGSGDTGVHTNDWDNHYRDISGNANHLSTWPIAGGPNRPAYTATVPYATVPQTYAANGLALDFAGNPAQDVSTFGEHTGEKEIESHMFEHWTVEATFKVDAVDVMQVIVGKDGQRGDLGGSGGIGDEAPFWLKVLPWDGRLELLAIDDDDTYHVAASLNPLVAGEWYSVAARFDGTAIDMWLKGPGDTNYVFQNCSDFFGPDVGGVGCSLGGFSGTNVMNGGAWSVGRGAWASGATHFADGIIDEVRISSVLLDPSEFLGSSGPTTLPEIGDIAIELLPGGSELALTWITSDLYTYNLLEAAYLSNPTTWITNQTVTGGVSSVTATTSVSSAKAFYKAESSSLK